MNTEQNLTKRKMELEKTLLSLEAKLRSLPEGRLECFRKGEGWKWYHVQNHTRTYIPQAERRTAEALALKTYYTRLLAECKAEFRATAAYLKASEVRPKRDARALLTSPAYQALLPPELLDRDQPFHAWMTEPYSRNPNHPEQLTVRTRSGVFVRSKSEALILTALQDSHVPFRYECALPLGSHVVYPDFTILHPKTGQHFLFEHFGMMDHVSYKRNALQKLDTYLQNGWVPMQNLITTYETSDRPLDIRLVYSLIEHFFLE